MVTSGEGLRGRLWVGSARRVRRFRLLVVGCSSPSTARTRREGGEQEKNTDRNAYEHNPHVIILSCPTAHAAPCPIQTKNRF